jgi:hypothetical protein
LRPIETVTAIGVLPAQDLVSSADWETLAVRPLLIDRLLDDRDSTPDYGIS